MSIIIDIKSGATCPTAKYQLAGYENLYKERISKCGGLVFFETTHEYRLDNVLIPSVTQVLDDVGLSDYSNIPIDVLAAAQERGDRVHEITRLYDICDLEVESLNDVGKKYLDSWIRFKEHYLHGVKFDLVEKPLASVMYRYAGTPDRVVDCSGKGERWVVFLSPEGMEGRLEVCKGKGDWSIFLSALNVYYAKRGKK